MPSLKVQIGAALGAAALLFSASASAQLGGLGDQLKRRAEQEAREAAKDAAAQALFPLEEDGAATRRQAAHLDSMDFGVFADMTVLDRTATGGFRLRPGAWTFTAQAYCLKPGAYERTGGAGLMSGEITGKLAPHIRTILASAYAHREVEQRNIQFLLWGVIAGVKISDMNDEAQAAARVLLTADQYRDLDGGELGWVPPELSARAISRLPHPARNAIHARNQLRLRAKHPNASYDDLEQIAVMRGEPPRTDDDVPEGRWSWHPDGFHIRYSGQSYRNVTVEIIVGEELTVLRDEIGRITEMRLPDGAYMRATYDDAIEPYRWRKAKGRAAYAFASVEIGAPDGAGGMLTERVVNQGFAWVTDRVGRRTEAAPLKRYAALDNNIRSDASPMRLAQIRVIDVTEARDRYEEVSDRYEYYSDRWDGATRPVTDEDLDAIIDGEHYREGAETVFGDTGERVDWIGRTHERLARALARATEIIDGMGEDDDDGSTYEPSEEVALPARSGYVQRRGATGRAW